VALPLYRRFAGARCAGARRPFALGSLLLRRQQRKGARGIGLGMRVSNPSSKLSARNSATRLRKVMAPVFSKRLSGVKPMPLL